MNKLNITTNLFVNDVLNRMVNGFRMVGKLIVYITGMAFIMLIIYCLFKSGIIPQVDLSGLKNIKYVARPSYTDWM